MNEMEEVYQSGEGHSYQFRPTKRIRRGCPMEKNARTRNKKGAALLRDLAVG